MVTLAQIEAAHREAQLGVRMLAGALRGVCAQKLMDPKPVALVDLARALLAVAQQKAYEAERPGWGEW